MEALQWGYISEISQGIDFNFIISNIFYILNIIIDLGIKVLAIYVMYLATKALKKYINQN